MTMLAIVRHGETDWNVEQRMQGHRDTPLNANGLEQAARIAERLAKQRWDVCIASDLRRASRTAALIADRAGIALLMFDPRLRERELGRLEGTTPGERLERWGEQWHELDHGTESPEALFDRAVGFIEEAADTHAGKRIVVVTHGGWIKQLFHGMFPDQAGIHPVNTSLSLIEKSNGRWRCLLYNCAAHLDN